VLGHPREPAARLIWTYAVAIGAFYGMVAIFSMFLGRQFGIGEKTIGYFFMWFGAAGVIVRTTLVGPVVRRYGEVRMAVAGLVLLASGLTLFPFSRGYPVLLTAMTLMPLGTAFTFPAVTALLSRVVSSKERGLYLGVQQTAGGVARVIFPWWDGWAFDHIGMATPFVVIGALTLGTVALIRGITAPSKRQPDTSASQSLAEVAPSATAPQTIGKPPATDRVGSA
jgi:predicted MFS family arabinose efflux permease